MLGDDLELYPPEVKALCRLAVHPLAVHPLAAHTLAVQPMAEHT